MKRFDVRVSVTVCFAVMILAAVAHAETVFVIGSGQFSCGQFIATIGKHPPGRMQTLQTSDGNFVSENVGYQQWLLGFVSGFNAAHVGEEQQQIGGIDLPGVDLWMRNWCNQHPAKLVSEGAVAFINEMRSNAAAGQR